MRKNVEVSDCPRENIPALLCTECSEIIEAGDWYYAVGKHTVCRECLDHFARRMLRVFRRRNGVHEQ